MVELLSDMETLLASDPHFLLGTWLSDAISYASDMKETFLMQNNARNQITIWGPKGEVCVFVCFVFLIFFFALLYCQLGEVDDLL